MIKYLSTENLLSRVFIMAVKSLPKQLKRVIDLQFSGFSLIFINGNGISYEPNFRYNTCIKIKLKVSHKQEALHVWKILNVHLKCRLPLVIYLDSMHVLLYYFIFSYMFTYFFV